MFDFNDLVKAMLNNPRVVALSVVVVGGVIVVLVFGLNPAVVAALLKVCGFGNMWIGAIEAFTVGWGAVELVSKGVEPAINGALLSVGKLALRLSK